MSYENLFRNQYFSKFINYALLHHIDTNIITIPYCRSPNFFIIDTDSFNAIQFIKSRYLKDKLQYTKIKNIGISGNNIIIFYDKEK